MSKRKADEIDEPMAFPQAKHTCLRVPGWIQYGEHCALPMVTTPPPEMNDKMPPSLELDEENSLIARLEATQMALLRHLEQKCKRLHFVLPQSSGAMESRLAKVADTMNTMNQEIEAIRMSAGQMNYSYQPPWNGLAACRNEKPTYFAPHQYVPIPQT